MDELLPPIKTKPKRAQYRSLPKKPNGQIDKEKVKEQYFASEHVEWKAFCESMKYNPTRTGEFPNARWVVQKKQARAYSSVRSELEERAINLGSRGLLETFRAVKDVPEVLSGVLQLCKYRIQEHAREIKYDQENEADYRNKLIEWQLSGEKKDAPPKRRFRAYSQDLLFLSRAVSDTSKMLYESLGIDNSNGVKPEQWMKMVEETGVRFDPTIKEQGADVEYMEVSIIGSDQLEKTLADAMVKYLDKPREPSQTTHEEVVLDEGVVSRYDEEDQNSD